MKKIHWLTDIIVSLLCTAIYFFIMKAVNGIYDFIITGVFFFIFFITILILDRSGVFKKAE